MHKCQTSPQITVFEHHLTRDLLVYRNLGRDVCVGVDTFDMYVIKFSIVYFWIIFPSSPKNISPCVQKWKASAKVCGKRHVSLQWRNGTSIFLYNKPPRNNWRWNRNGLASWSLRGKHGIHSISSNFVV